MKDVNRTKGIILAGGKGTRLDPITKAVSKVLLPVFDKPMVYYPLSLLISAGVRDILLISTPDQLDSYRRLLSDGSNLGIELTYAEQPNPNGIAEAFIIGEDFIGDNSVCLVLGDNLFYSENLAKKLKMAMSNNTVATIFACEVSNPSDFGVVEFDVGGKAMSLEEKPKIPKSNFAVPGLYIYDDSVVEVAKNVSMSGRGEYEITDVNGHYLRCEQLNVEMMDEDTIWFDTGTHESLLMASNFIKSFQIENGQYVGCIEEAAFLSGFIDRKQLFSMLDCMPDVDYKKYLEQFV